MAICNDHLWTEIGQAAKAAALLAAMMFASPALARQPNVAVGAGKLAGFSPPQSGTISFRGNVLPASAELAVHPKCFVSSDHLIVRGEAYDADQGRLATGATVTLRNGERDITATAGSDGFYMVVAPLTDARTVRVVRVTMPSADGPRIVNTIAGAAVCVALAV